jgi:hypothetical protein
MIWLKRKLRKKTYYCLGWVARGREAGIFRDVDFAQGRTPGSSRKRRRIKAQYTVH